ncbi:MAG TPA: cytochrome C [Thermoanaerobaculia bacterium]|nr:cytochrome C [Thermoanaerobaculia bacterium]
MRGKRGFAISSLGLGALVLGALAVVATDMADQEKAEAVDSDVIRSAEGFRLSPVPIRGHSAPLHELVGLGSYLVNTVGDCSGCHTSPAFVPGGDPFHGQPTKVNTAGFLAGGRAFGPFTSRNLTPDEHGLPAGMTFAQFLKTMRTGVDLEHKHPAMGPLLQVMPWPDYRHMSDRELFAMYQYLRLIPSLPGND